MIARARVRRSKRAVDPTKVRLSEHFLLSDFMGCHSVYARGYPNVFEDPEGTKLEEGKYLCDTLLEPLLAKFGPFSIGYGYVSPELSRQIVKYQDPNKPSYHRWDKGAAADICMHAWVKKHAPVYLAHEIDEEFSYSRMITYSESPYVCVATQIGEKGRGRRAFYENQYEGKPSKKPKYVQYSANEAVRERQRQEHSLSCGWAGAGYPTYHGGGVLQWHHKRASRYTMISDFLYNPMACSKGVSNIPDRRISREIFEQAGECYDEILKSLSIPRMSIVRGFESHRINKQESLSWREFFCMDIVPPEYVTPTEVAQAAWNSRLVCSVSSQVPERLVRLTGRKL